MKTSKLLIAVTCFGSISAFASGPVASPTPAPSPTNTPQVNVSGQVGGRFDYQKDGDIRRLQDTVVLKFVVNTWNEIELVGVIQNTPKYGLKYHTAYDLNQDKFSSKDDDLYLRRIYLRRSFGKFAGELGALGQMDSIGGHTAFGNSSWVDGARVTVKTEAGLFGVTAGSLNDLNNPDVLNRERKLNYVEVYMRKEVFEKILTEASVGHLDSSNFIRLAASRDFTILSDRIVRLAVEGLADRENGADQPKYSAAIKATTDLLALAKPSAKGYVTLGLQYSYGDPNIGLRGKVNDDRYMTGHNLNISTNIHFKKNSRFNMTTGVDIREDPRYQVGFGYNLRK